MSHLIRICIVSQDPIFKINCRSSAFEIQYSDLSCQLPLYVSFRFHGGVHFQVSVFGCQISVFEFGRVVLIFQVPMQNRSLQISDFMCQCLMYVFRLLRSGFRFQISVFKLQISISSLHISVSNFQICYILVLRVQLSVGISYFSF